MSDTPKLPSSNSPKAEPDIKDAVPAGKGAPLPTAKQLTLSHQFFIWTMIVIVGVLFGVGSSCSMLNQPARVILNVDEGEITPRIQIAERLEKILNPNSRPWEQPEYAISRQTPNFEQQYAMHLRLARHAMTLGLMPRGAALDKIEQDFLSTQMPGSTTRNFADALTEHEDGADRVTREELRRFLGERAARRALQMRFVILPAVARTAGSDVKATHFDQCQMTEIVLTGTALLPAVPDNDPEIQTTYEKLRKTSFTRPAGVAVAVALADREKLGAALTISDDDAKIWYEAHKDQFPSDPDPKVPMAKPSSKSFDQVKDQVIAKLRSERGAREAQQLVEGFNANVAEALELKNSANEFRTAVSTAKLELVEQFVEDRTPGTIDLGKLGKMKDVMHLFSRDHEVGFLSQPIETSLGNWVVLRIEAPCKSADFQTLEEVKGKVISHLAGRRAWKRLLEEAGKIRDAAAAKGPGGLAAWAASPEAKSWNVTPTTKDVTMSQQLAVTPTEADGAVGDPLVIASLLLPGRPVHIIAAEKVWDGDVPCVRLVQAGDFKPGTREIPNDRLVGAYRESIGAFSMELYNNDILQKMGVR